VIVVVAAFVTALVVDNVWLSVVARQPDKIYGLKHSSLFHDMRLYVNAMNVLGLLIATPLGAAIGAGLGAIGAVASDRVSGRPPPDTASG
jgi:hypothetical protein